MSYDSCCVNKVFSVEISLKTFSKREKIYVLLVQKICNLMSHLIILMQLNQFQVQHAVQPGQSKKISNDQELIQSDPTSCPQNLFRLISYELYLLISCYLFRIGLKISDASI